jgi:Na+-translocating ferredoxin:NAD+ oxidoreductase RnfG subunit
VGLLASPSTTVYATFADASQHMFPDATVITHNIQLAPETISVIESNIGMTLPSQNATIFEYKDGPKRVGFSMVTNHIGKHYPITFFVGLFPDLRIKGIEVMVYREDYGAEVRKRRFLKQFRGKSHTDPIAVNHDITSVSGATLSSYAIANGARQVIQTVVAVHKGIIIHND